MIAAASVITTTDKPITIVVSHANSRASLRIAFHIYALHTFHNFPIPIPADATAGYEYTMPAEIKGSENTEMVAFGYKIVSISRTY